jgi:hypothetical protein
MAGCGQDEMNDDKKDDMNDQHSQLLIRTYETDGSVQTIAQNDPELVGRILSGLNPAALLNGNGIGNSGSALRPRPFARVDLITDRLSVWDFPFVLGAPVELAESEFANHLQQPGRWKLAAGQSDIPVFLNVAMATGQHCFFEMEVAGGWSALNMNRLRSIFKAPHLIFGLRPDGIGILNLAKMAHFSVYPEPPDAVAETHSAHSAMDRNKFGLPKFQIRQQSEDRTPHLVGLTDDPDDSF